MRVLLSRPRFVVPVAVVALLVAAGEAIPGNAGSPPACPSGEAAAPVVIEVFSDFQCPACRGFYLGNLEPSLAELGGEGRICVVHRHHPLERHPQARAAARLAVAVEDEPREVRHRLIAELYRNQHEWAVDGDFAAALEPALGTDEWTTIERATAARAVADADAAIDADLALARRRGVESTPTVFVWADGEAHPVPSTVEYPIFRRFLMRLLAEAESPT